MHEHPRAFPRLGHYFAETLSLCEEVLGLLKKNVAAHIRDGISQRNAFRADFDAILRKAALLNAAVTDESA